MLGDLQLFGRSDLSRGQPVWYHFSSTQRLYNRRQGLDVLLDHDQNHDHSPNAPSMLDSAGTDTLPTTSTTTGGATETTPAAPETSAFLFSYPDQDRKRKEDRAGSHGDGGGGHGGAEADGGGGSGAYAWSRRAAVRLPNTAWSKPFNVDSLGVDNEIQLMQTTARRRWLGGAAQPGGQADENQPDDGDDAEEHDGPPHMYEIGVSVSNHPNPRFARTKLVTFHSRYVLTNGTRHPLQYRQCATSMVQTLFPGQQRAFHRFDGSKKNHLCLRLQAFGSQWAASKYGLDVGKEGITSVRLRNTHTHEIEVLHVFSRLVQNSFQVGPTRTTVYTRTCTRTHVHVYAHVCLHM